jgi:hypothetical protein
MAKAVISITTKEKVESTAKRSLPSEYDIIFEGRKMKRCLTDTLDVIEVDRGKDVKLLQIPLTRSNGFVYEIPIPSDPKSRKKIVESFMAEHPFAYDVSEKYSKAVDRPIATCKFTVSDELIQVFNNIDKEKVEVYQTFNSLTIDEKKAIAIYFGQRAYEMDEDEIDRAMVGLDQGLITSIEKNRKEFIERLELMFNKKEVNVKIAMTYNVLVTDGTVYMIKGRILGTTAAEIIQKVTAEDDVYNLILNEMADKGIAIYGGRNSKEKAETVKVAAQKASVKA